MKKIILFLLASFGLLVADTRVYHQKVDVIRSEPFYKTITKQIPYEECRDVEYEQKVPSSYTTTSRRQNNDNHIGLDTLIGVAGGAVVGNQIGKGNGRVAAKIIAGLLGGALANNMRSNRETTTYQSNDYYYETKTIRKCKTKYETYKEEVNMGYKNYFIYQGKEIFKITNRPKKRLHLKNTISF